MLNCILSNSVVEASFNRLGTKPTFALDPFQLAGVSKCDMAKIKAIISYASTHCLTPYAVHSKITGKYSVDEVHTMFVAERSKKTKAESRYAIAESKVKMLEMVGEVSC